MTESTQTLQSAIATLTLMIIGCAGIAPVHADTVMFTCNNNGKHSAGATYQDRPCNAYPSPGEQTRSQASARQTEIVVQTPKLGYSGRVTASSGGGYYVAPFKQPNSFQDSYTPSEYDIEKVREKNKMLNRKRQCQAIRKELWRIQYAQPADNGKANSDAKPKPQVETDPWLQRRRAMLESRVKKECSNIQDAP